MTRNPRLGLPLALLLATGTAQAAWPVIDVGAIAQLVSQLRTMQNQLTTARDQLTEARSTLNSLTGTRGMEQLLTDAPRNYLPTDWTELADTLTNTSARYGALAADVQRLITQNSVLPASDLARLTPTQQRVISESRQNSAGLAALTRAALQTSSGRFASLNELIRAISTATDPKAVYDLQARIAAETGMLQNEATKLQALYQGQAAQEALRVQRLREQGIADTGSLRKLPPLGLN
jgi:type IV secretion system protein VirB5